MAAGYQNEIKAEPIAGGIEVDVEAVRGKRVEEDDRSGRFFAAVRVDGLGGDARPHFFKYLKSLTALS